MYKHTEGSRDDNTGRRLSASARSIQQHNGYKVLVKNLRGADAAALVSQAFGAGRENSVHHVSLAQLLSGHPGDVEKNILSLFDQAEKENWILFFDEADALFGKRTTVSDAHDKYANQEIDYLLQRIKSFGGKIIFGSADDCDDPESALPFDHVIKL